jgi:hypothetical protein
MIVCWFLGWPILECRRGNDRRDHRPRKTDVIDALKSADEIPPTEPPSMPPLPGRKAALLSREISQCFTQTHPVKPHFEV